MSLVFSIGLAIQHQTRRASALPPAAPPANVALPAITGTAEVGQTLTASTGTWTNSPTSHAYVWRRGGVAIGGAVAATYALVPADLGAVITVTVTAANADGSASATSAGTAPVTAAALGFELLNESGSATITAVPNLRVSLDGGATWLTLAAAGLTIARDGTDRLRVAGFASTAARNAALFHYEQRLWEEPNNAINTLAGLFARRIGDTGPALSVLPGMPISATVATAPVGVT
jgi:hypothetical protein